MDRRAEIEQIVTEEHDRKWAEHDRHGHVWVADMVTEVEVAGRTIRRVGGAVCKCGYQPARPHGAHARVSVGVHIQAAQRKADKTYHAEVDRRIAETRQPVR